MHLPTLIVFDLDYTLWDCGGTWCDCLTPPFSQSMSGPVDRYGRIVTLYEGVLAALDFCESNNIDMALASRTAEPGWARQLIEMLGIFHRFKYKEIFPSTKVVHFNNLRNSSREEFTNMLFYDDEWRNIEEVGNLGVTSIYVENGLSYKVFEEGLKKWQKNNS